MTKSEITYRLLHCPRDSICDFHFKDTASHRVEINDNDNNNIGYLDLCPVCYQKFLKNESMSMDVVKCYIPYNRKTN